MSSRAPRAIRDWQEFADGATVLLLTHSRSVPLSGASDILRALLLAGRRTFIIDVVDLQDFDEEVVRELKAIAELLRSSQASARLEWHPNRLARATIMECALDDVFTPSDFIIR